MKVLSLILALLQFKFGFCLYEDQIGIFDWRQSYIGHVTHAAYDAIPDSSGNRAVFVGASHTGVIGALSTKDGSVIWRHVFGENERISLLTLYGDCLLVVIGKTARCFYPEGILKTQLSLPINDNEEIKFSHTTDETIVFGTDSNFCLLKGNEYKCIPLTGVPKNSFHVNCLNDVTGCVISQEGSTITIFQADVERNEKVSKISKGSVSGQVTNCGGGFDGKGYSCLLSTGKILSQPGFAHFDSSKVGFLDPESCALNDNEMNKVKKSKFIGNYMFAEYENGKTVLCDLKQSKKLESNGGNLVDAAEVKFEGDNKLFKLVHTGEANYRLELSDHSGAEIAHSTFQCNEIAKEGVGLLIPIVLKKRGTSSGNAPILRCLIRSKFDSLIFVQAASVKWVRDEGLGQSVSATFFDLPLPDYLADIASEVMDSSNNIFLNFVRRVRFESDILFSTVFDLVDGYSNGGFGALLNINKDVKHSLLHHAVHRHTSDGRNVDVELHRDKFGLEKLILVATRPGKVFAIHSLTGVVVWDLFFQDCSPISINQIRGTDNADLPSVVTVVGQNLKSNGQLCLVSFDGLTGELQEKLTLPYLPGVVKSFPHTDPETHITPLLFVVPSLNSVSVYPEIELKFVKMHSGDVFLHMVTENPTQQPTLNGFRLQDANSNLKMKETWSVVIPNGENVVYVAEKRADERIYSKAIVLADRTVLYKFMNPNLIFVVTSNALDQDKKEGDADTLNAYLLDSVSGRFYFQGQHRHAKGPVFAVNAENFVVYSYWNSQMRRTEISVVELFEGKTEKNATAFSSFDYYGPDVPMVMKQSYVFNDNIRSMVLTSSRRGITSKSVIVGLSSGRVLEIPKLILNPRRLMTITPEHQEEGLPPYIPEIMPHPESFTNYNQSLTRISNMYTVASGLESTSLLFVTGLDIYFARVWPSKMFDMLKEDFDYAFIILITVGLATATYVLRYLVQRKEVKKAWQ